MHPLDRVIVLRGGVFDHLMQKVSRQHNLFKSDVLTEMTISKEIRLWMDHHTKGGYKIIADVYRCFVIFENTEDASLFSIFWL